MYNDHGSDRLNKAAWEAVIKLLQVMTIGTIQSKQVPMFECLYKRITKNENKETCLRIVGALTLRVEDVPNGMKDVVDKLFELISQDRW